VSDLTERQQRIVALADSEPVRELTDAAPELTEDQLSELALIFRQVVDDDDAP
jgi:hypothetical protein